MAEIRSLKRILDASKDASGVPVLCCIDEVLRGTNTIERIAASCEILKEFAKEKILCLAATHDIELTRLLTEYDQYHFREEMGEKDVTFSYKLYSGPATGRNAIRLLGAAGFDASVTQRAMQRTEEFERTGKWL